MTPLEIGYGSVGAILVLVYLGLHVPVALALVSFVGVWAIKGDEIIAMRMLGIAANDGIADYIFGVIPLFVLMGLLVSVSGIAKDTFDAAGHLLRRVRGGLGVATVAANAGFAAVTGISIASAAVFTKVAVPEMLRMGYEPRFAVGIVAGSAVLGMLIPPSLLLIVYAVLTETSVGDMFLAGLVPGLLLASLFIGWILALSWLRPQVVGGMTVQDDGPAPSVRRIALNLGWLVSLIGLVMGGIYGGIFTPTEAGAAGATGALVLALLRRRLNLHGFWRVLTESGHVTASICILVISATMYSRMLTMSGVPNAVAGFLGDVGFGMHGTLLIYVLLIFVMGTVLDAVSILLIAVPIALPIFQGFGVDLVWFGIVTVIAVEVGMLTPPLGIAVFVIKGTLDRSDISLGDIFAGAAPFVLLMCLTIALLTVFPWLALVAIR